MQAEQALQAEQANIVQCSTKVPLHFLCQKLCTLDTGKARIWHDLIKCEWRGFASWIVLGV